MDAILQRVLDIETHAKGIAGKAEQEAAEIIESARREIAGMEKHFEEETSREIDGIVRPGVDAAESLRQQKLADARRKMREWESLVEPRMSGAVDLVLTALAYPGTSAQSVRGVP